MRYGIACLVTRSTIYSPTCSNHLSTRSTRLTTRSTCLFISSTRLSIRLSTRNTLSAICRSFYNGSL